MPLSWSPGSGELELCSGWDVRIYFETLDGPGTEFLVLLCDEVLGRGEGILSKSMSDVRATGRMDDRCDFAGEIAGRALARFCIGPGVIVR
jgi:hypothetical protein